MENSPATGQDEGRLPGAERRGPLGSGRVDGRWLGEQMPGLSQGCSAGEVWMEGGHVKVTAPSSPTPPKLGKECWAPAKPWLSP